MTRNDVTKVQSSGLPTKQQPTGKSRKSGINRNKEGSVRKVNGKVYVDFKYLGDRVRETSGLPWNNKNAKLIRDQLDRIIVSIKSGEFRFAESFPHSKKTERFTKKEYHLFGGNTATSDQVLFKEYASTWYDLLKDSERVEPRTLWGYKSYLKNYLLPYFGDFFFADLNKGTFDRFVSWAKKQKYRGKPLSNTTVNKIFVPMKMICTDVAIEYGWGENYNPFFGFKKPSEDDPYEIITPFSIEEQVKIIECLSDHWKPFFLFAFAAGLRQGEQIALKHEDIDWTNCTLQISRAVTRDENGKFMVGNTKNKYSRRSIRLIRVMKSALEKQKKIYDRFNCKYFFCTTTGKRVRSSNLRKRVWIPALKMANVKYREMKQTRHSFATNALSCGESPLWIARVMGHRDTDMIIKVYGKYIENAARFNDGNKLDAMYRGNIGKEE